MSACHLCTQCKYTLIIQCTYYIRISSTQVLYDTTMYTITQIIRIGVRYYGSHLFANHPAAKIQVSTIYFITTRYVTLSFVCFSHRSYLSAVQNNSNTSNENHFNFSLNYQYCYAKKKKCDMSAEYAACTAVTTTNDI